MKTVAKLKMFISYTWRPDDPSNPNDNPEARGLKLADRLRAAGLDSRIDKYFLHPRPGFVKPYRRPGDKVEPWVIWAGAQIQDADFVLLVCSAQYAATVCKSPLWDDSTGERWPDVPDDLKFKLQEPDLTWEHWHAMSGDLKFKLQEYQNDESKGKKNKVPYTWWDWHFMIQDMESGRAERQKFIPVGFGPYSSVSKHVPYFTKGESYYNLDSDEDFEGLLRGIRTQFRIQHPRDAPRAAGPPKAANVESSLTDIQQMAPVPAVSLTQPLQGESQENSAAKTADPRKKTRRVVAIMHGIRDEGGWMTPLKRLIEKETGAEVAALSPDRIALTWFLLGGRYLGYVKMYRDDVATLLSNYHEAEIIFVAHSYGTWCLADVIKHWTHSTDVMPVGIILCGSILPQHYPWSDIWRKVFVRPRKQDELPWVWNDIGGRDPFPLLARLVSKQYGDAGVSRFNLR